MLNNAYIKQSLSAVVTVSMLAITPLVFADTSASTASYAANTNSTGTSISDSDSMSSSSSSLSSHTIPVGTSFLLRPTGSIPMNVGDTFTSQLVNPITATDGVTALPAGSQVKGEITAVNTNQNTVDVKFRNVSTTTGVTVPINAHTTISTLQSGVQSQVASSSTTTTNGSVNSTYGNNGFTFFPTVSFGKSNIPPVAKVAAGTLGGAVLGATTGALTGVITKAVYSGSMRGEQGTWAIRDGLWGAALGGAIGLTAGVITAVATRNTSNVTTTTGYTQPTTRPVTNISTGSLEEIPTSYNSTSGSSTMPDFTIILDRPAYVSQS